MRDDETESHREEQGKPPRADPREHMGDVPIVFSSEGGGAGVLLPGADERLGPPPGEAAEAADATRAVERGAAAIEAERRAGGAGHAGHSADARAAAAGDDERGRDGRRGDGGGDAADGR
jgi:hypothetical protein